MGKSVFSVLDHFQNLMGSKLDQDTSSDFLGRSKLCNLSNKQTNGQTDKKANDHENNTSLSEIKMAREIYN